jgi:hypothetical protein
MRPRRMAAIEIVAADHALPRANEEFQEVEDLRLDRDEVIAAAQLAAVGIEDEVLNDRAKPWPAGDAN